MKIFICLFAVATLVAQEKVTYIKAAAMFDGTGMTLRKNVVIAIQGTQIVSIDQVPPPNADVIDLGDMTVLPGLIDCHTHIVLHPGGYEKQILRETPEFRAIYGTRLARITLEAGFTTIRDLGNEGAGLADIALRDAIDQGIVPGPKILAAIQPITATGSYDLVGYSPYVSTPPISFHADGPENIRAEVRKVVKLGADVIKIYVESFEKKQTTEDSLTGVLTYAPDELKGLVEEARRAGLKVAAHTYSDSGARMALAAGVHSIEHGLYIKEATFKEMAAKGIFYVPTLLVYEMWRDGEIFSPVPESDRKKLSVTAKAHAEAFRQALKTKVKIAFGTDTFELPGTNAREFRRMTAYGMKPVDALRSATSVAAECLGLEKQIGTLEPGKMADIIAVRGNPLEDIQVTENVTFVMKSGRVIIKP